MVASTRLWAPWRSRFIMHPTKRGCIFCQALRSRNDRRSQVILRRPKAFALLNRYPYNNGHVMVAPRRHVGDLLVITPAEWAGMLSVTQQVMRRLHQTLRPHGFNLGLNLGRIAGAGIPGHLHLHLVPRWKGDTNFMPVLTGTKVVSQSLDELYALFTTSRR